MDDNPALELLSGFSVSALIAGVIFGIVGYYVYRWGKKNFNMRVRLIGVALMIYPYLTPTAFLTWAVGFGLCFLAYLWR